MVKFNKETVRPAENFFAGQVDIVDPSTDEKFRGDAGATTYWRNGGTVSAPTAIRVQASTSRR